MVRAAAKLDRETLGHPVEKCNKKVARNHPGDLAIENSETRHQKLKRAPSSKRKSSSSSSVPLKPLSLRSASSK